jgi:tetratricopeptide (TPR) repeat protein
MYLRNPIALLLLALHLLSGCGPDTIFVRPALDTPTQHVQNGYNFLARGKIDAAGDEFNRAISLDDRFAPAYVGLGLVQGHRGDFEAGFEALARARDVAASAEETADVERGLEALQELQAASRK